MIPLRIRGRIYASWSQAKKADNLDAYGVHAMLLMDVEQALEGERPWDSIPT